MWWILVVLGLVALAHTAPAPFLLDAVQGDRAVWHMPRHDPATVYLTFDDGPNPTTTPALLDVLEREHVHATFFLIDRHVTEETAPIIRRMFADGHAVGLHSATRREMLRSGSDLASRLTTWADHMEATAGRRPCRLFRPHAGWRSRMMFDAMREADYRLVGWGWMLWDFDWFRGRTAEHTVQRIASRAGAGDIVVMHDGDEKTPRKSQQQTVDATAALIPALRARGLAFGTICQNGS